MARPSIYEYLSQSSIFQALVARVVRLEGRAAYTIPNDGITDVTAVLTYLGTLGPVTLPAGQYLINGNAVLSNKLTRLEGATITVAAGGTLTLNKGMEASDSRVFSGGGTTSIAGDVKVAWWAGDLVNTTTNSYSLVQKAYNACLNNGQTVLWPYGYLCTDGTAAVSVAKGQQTKGKGRGGGGSSFRWTGSQSRCLLLSTTPGAKIESMSFESMDRSILATAGSAIEVTAQGSHIENYRVSRAYDSVNIHDTSGVEVRSSRVEDGIRTGIYPHACNDVIIDGGLIVSPLDYITMSNVTGTLAAGATFTGATSGAVGFIGSIITPTFMQAKLNTINFTAGETVNCSNGASFVVVSQTVCHSLGGLRLQDKAEAITVMNLDIIGGQRTGSADAAANGVGTRPAYSTFTNVYFDSGDFATAFNNCEELEFNACWWSGRPNGGGLFTNCDGLTFNTGKAVNCFKDGIVIDATCTNVVFNGFKARGNSQLSPGVYSGIIIVAGTKKFTITGCIGDDAGIGFGTQKYAVNVQPGASDNYVIANNRMTAAQINDGGTGTSKFVGNNF